MEYRALGTSGLEVSAIALGCLGMGGGATCGPVDDNESIATIHAALDLGVNLIDTAPSQGNGHSEEIVGKAIQGRRSQVLIATKCGLLGGSFDSEPRRCLTADAIRRECERSLRRLRIETIDLYQCHWPDPSTPIAETLSAMDRLETEGKIRAIGLSNYGCQRLAEARAAGNIHSVQLLLSVLEQRATDELIPYCQEHRLGVLACGALLRGLLTGKFTPDSSFDDQRCNDPDFQGRRFTRNLELVEKLSRIAENYGRTVGQLALNWACYYPGVSAVVAGAKRPSQIKESIDALGWTIGPEDLDSIQAILRGPEGTGL